MAQQRQFNQNQQGDTQDRNPETLLSDRGTGTRSATFVGGDVDTKTGNLKPGSVKQASQGFTVTGSEEKKDETPAQTTTAEQTVNNVTAEDTTAQTTTQQEDSSSQGFYRKDRKNAVETVASWFCYGAGVEILMEDGTYKPVQNIDLGDRLMLGGEVIAVGKAKGSFTFNYKGQQVTGSHAVFEDGRFVRVYESKLKPAEDEFHGAVHPIVTEHNLMVTKTHISADFGECPGGELMTPVQRLSKLNREVERLQWLRAQEARFCRVEA